MLAIVMGAVLLGISASSVAFGLVVGEPARARAVRRALAVPTTPNVATPADPALAHTAAVQLDLEPELQPPIDPGLVAYHGPRTGDRVAITFDDGPSPTITPRVLEVLRLHDVHATFFLLGTQVEKFPALARDIADAGHDLANHSLSHRSFRSLFPSEITRELDRTDAAIAAATGLHPRFVRPPYGRFPDSTIALVRDRGGDLVLWSVDAADWGDAAPERIAAAVVEAAEPGAIILLHDREPATVRALPEILAGLRRRGLEPVSVAELLERPAYLATDEVARVARASG
jgi:peptidoglycan/xylan/chitin deacetylase (PgdA/CDA1 family)